ncbi:N-acetyltransferase [Streptomyces sp. B15]|uniref:GNAT family N-acetyltransferase n=1 Tax=Streptomyces sp. B15 TaxID=1537797 RepID=UPI001B3773A3|nr:GNAT family N-acetyltransferase [Streptomyces sp. B15]MBQ1122461.1 GNAT family N-acetyltransferase [Streptomyces sp. B15]
MSASSVVTMRPYESTDEAAVLEIVNEDGLPGQPRVSAGMLAEALAGRSEVDSGWWAALAPPRTDVAVDASGQVVGVVSFAVHSAEPVGFLLWLHCREDESVALALVTHACAELGTVSVHAFDFATALTRGVEALPVRHRQATHRALLKAGFTGEDLWRYMRMPLESRALLPRGTGRKARKCEDGNFEVRVRDRWGRKVGEVVVGVPVAGTGVLWWISVEERARGRGLGRALVGSALRLLVELGAREVILYVDDGPRAGNDRAAANALYESVGFAEVDRLWFYTRGPAAPAC